MHSKRKKLQRGAAMLIVMFALLLLLAIGFVMIFMSGTESKIDFNFRQNKLSYYASRAGLEEVRDRFKNPSTVTNGIANLVPGAVPGQTGGVLYILNPDTTVGETAGGNGASAVNPTDPANKYFDIEFCHEWNSGATAGVQCPTAPTATVANVVPTAANWALPFVNSAQVNNGHLLPYKWVRFNMKTNRITQPYCVDNGACASATLDYPICWDGAKEVMATSALATACGAQGMQQVYLVTSFADNPNVISGARSVTRYEIVRNSTRLDGVIEMDACCRSRGDFKGPSVPPLTTIDGRAHDINGNLIAGPSSCGSSSAVATDTPTSPPNGNGDELPGDLNDLESQIPQNKCVGTAPNCTNGFIGAPGNQQNGIVNQALGSGIPNQLTPVTNLIQTATSNGTTLNWSQGVTSGNTLTFGSQTNPVVVNVPNVLTIDDGGGTIKGFGVLVVSQDFELKNVNFQWTGLVVITSGQTEFRIDSNATGFINGAIVMQGTEARIRTSDSDSGVFNITYSCDAIDMAFKAVPVKIISYSEVAY